MAKLLVDCTNEELFAEEKLHGQHTSKIHRIRKQKIWFWIKVFATAMVILAFWFKLNGGLHILMPLFFILNMMILIIGLNAAQRHDQEFYDRQIMALQEIRYILRERGVR